MSKPCKMKCTKCKKETRIICACGKCPECNNMKNQLNHRLDGRVEWVCKHGVGHTIFVPKQYEDYDSWWSHCCDGCCKDIPKFKCK